jgi:hypothetical protein
MDELQTIVKLLESNTLELEDSLAQYERGVALLKSLKNRLSQASFKVESLMDELEVNEDDKQRDTTLS